MNLFLYSAVYIPLERLFALHPEQPTFRKGWVVDLINFETNSLAVKLLTPLTMKPATIFFDWGRAAEIVQTVTSLPLLIQIVACLLEQFTFRCGRFWLVGTCPHRTITDFRGHKSA